MQDAASSISSINTVWVLISAFLVFFMQPGFALLEAGFTRSKNAVNVVMKGFLDACFAALAYYIVGFGIMFGAGTAFFGNEYFMLNGAPEVWGTIPTSVYFLFQVAFASAATTILAGAIAERMKFNAYVIFSILMSALIYPVIGHWIWGGGWLATRGFLDFAGSTVVHSVGGWASLAGVLVIGSRIGRFDEKYDKKKFSGHSIPLAALGTFILWFGWFGFNPGSQLAAEGAENATAIGLISLNTYLAAAAGAVSAVVLGWLRTGISKAGFALNGGLGGLVAITASCAFVTPNASIIIGLIGGLITVFVAEILEKAKLDDAVGAIPVHLGGGIFGTMAVGFFHSTQGLFYGGGAQLLGAQMLGILTVGMFTLIISYAIFRILKATIGLRAGEKEEKEGLDLMHGQAAYPDFSHI